MREIKFRGICNVQANSHLFGSWIYGGIKFKKIKGVRTCFICDENSGGDYSVYSETIGQFTGLKDKNGVEIYEGDIFCREFREIKYSIVFENGSFYCYHTKQKDIFNNPYRWGLLSRAFEVDIARWGEVEVIGNIHDNPELLTKN